MTWSWLCWYIFGSCCAQFVAVFPMLKQQYYLWISSIAITLFGASWVQGEHRVSQSMSSAWLETCLVCILCKIRMDIILSEKCHTLVLTKLSNYVKTVPNAGWLLFLECVRVNFWLSNCTRPPSHWHTLLLLSFLFISAEICKSGNYL